MTVLFVRSSQKLAQILWLKGDVGGIDHYGPNGIARMAMVGSFRVRPVAGAVIFIIMPLSCWLGCCCFKSMAVLPYVCG